ncbi:MAG: hypothetical protein ACK5NQ_11345 [Pseudomonas sp.]
MKNTILALILLASLSALAQTPSQLNDEINQDGVWFENTTGRDKLKYGKSMIICFPALIKDKKFQNHKTPSTIDASCTIYLTNAQDETIHRYNAYINPASGKVEFGLPNNGTYTTAPREHRELIPKSNLLEMHARQWLEQN